MLRDSLCSRLANEVEFGERSLTPLSLIPWGDARLEGLPQSGGT